MRKKNNEDDGFHDSGGPNGGHVMDDDGYVYGTLCSGRNSAPRRRTTQKSNGDVAAGRGTSSGGDVEAEDRTARVLQSEEARTVEAPEEKKEYDDGEKVESQQKPGAAKVNKSQGRFQEQWSRAHLQEGQKKNQQETMMPMFTGEVFQTEWQHFL